MQVNVNKNIRKLKYFLFILPVFVLWVIFYMIPNIEIFPLSLYKWDGIAPVKTYVGFRNFKIISLDGAFWDCFKNTVAYILFMFIVSNIMSLLIGVLLKNNNRLNKFLRTLFFSPIVLSTIMVGMIWSYMYDPNIGIINSLLDVIGLDSLKQNWLGYPITGTMLIALVHFWHNAGTSITIIIAGLQTIPESLYEAANVEGANPIKTFFKITLPLIMPIYLRVMLLSIIGSSLAFDYPYTLGGPNQVIPTDTLSVYMYKAISSTTYLSNIGVPSAVGVILATFIFIMYLIQYMITKKIENSLE